MNSREKLALEAVELMKEFYSNLASIEVIGEGEFFEKIEVIESGNKIIYESVCERKEKVLDIENVSELIHEEIYGWGPCPGIVGSMIEEHIESIHCETREEEEKEIKKARDIEARGDEILELLKGIEKEVKNLKA